MQIQASSGRTANQHKLYVSVRCDHEIGGKVSPLMFKVEGGDPVRIDRILSSGPAAALKAGGQGIRYVCQVGDQKVNLFHAQADWFIELD